MSTPAPNVNPLAGKATGNGEIQPINPVEIRRALALLLDREEYAQLQSIPSGRHLNFSGGDYQAALTWLESNSDGAGCYWMLNPIRQMDAAAKVGDVIRRRWLLVDLDWRRQPDETKTCNTSTMEHTTILGVAQLVRRDLAELGWGQPVVIDSGNGWHVLYRIDLPNDEPGRLLVKRVLIALGCRYDTAQVYVDLKMTNANRISKLPGTWARKAPHTPERPQRGCRINSEGDGNVVPVELLQAMADSVHPDETAVPPPAKPTNGSTPASPLAGKAKASNGQQNYGQVALQGEIKRLLAAPVGERNNQLNLSAFALGTLVGSGALTRLEAETALLNAAATTGLSDSEIRATVKSGLDAGTLKPRIVPELHAQTPASPLLDPADETRVIVWGSEVTPKTVEFLWPDRIPCGKLTTFAGVGGLGKTFVLLDMAARITAGAPWPDSDQANKVGKVVFISGEDEADDTLVPRLIQMNADLRRISFLTTEAQGFFTLTDLTLLKKVMRQTGDGIRLVVIDPPTAYLGDTDDHKNSELRRLLTPLARLAADSGAAIVFNTHVNKAAGTKDAMMRVMGSAAWVNAVRAAHMFGRSRDDWNIKLFVPMKNNLGPEKKGLSYRLTFQTGGMAHVEWLGEVDETADQAVNKERCTAEPGTIRGTPRGEKTAQWLISLFREKQVWTQTEFWERARPAGITKDSIADARKILDFPACRREIDPDGKPFYTWHVPPDWPYLAGK